MQGQFAPKDEQSQPNNNNSAHTSQPQGPAAAPGSPTLAESIEREGSAATRAVRDGSGRTDHGGPTASDLHSGSEQEAHNPVNVSLHGDAVEELKSGQSESNRQLQVLGEIMTNATQVLVSTHIRKPVTG